MDLEINKPAYNLLSILSGTSEFRGILTHESFALAIKVLLCDPKLQTSLRFTEEDYAKFTCDLRDLLLKMATQHWIVIPLRGTTLSATVKLRDFVFLTGSREEKVKTLSRLGKVTLAKARFRANHTEVSRADGFFHHPLLAIRICHQTDFVYEQARLIALWSIAILQAIYWGYEYSQERQFRFLPVAASEQGSIANHLAIWSKDDTTFGHLPLDFSERCDFDISWMSQKANQKRFRKLFQKVVIGRYDNSLNTRFFKALRLFAKAVDTESNRGAFEGLGISVLYLTTTAEALLLSNDNEKRLRLTALLPRLSNLRGSTFGDYAKAVDSVYRWRNSFVHSGEDVFHDWDDEFNSGDKAKKVMLVKRMIAKILADAPKHID